MDNTVFEQAGQAPVMPVPGPASEDGMPASPDLPVAAESVQRAKFIPLAPEPHEDPLGKIDYLRDVDLEASVELGSAVMTVENILGLQTGSLVELRQTVGDPVRLLINGSPYALGEVVVIGEKFGVRLTKLLQAS